jgi:tRNA dimethylallyltransferase
MSYPAVIIGGPTASGKSHLAVELADCINGEIINGDSMQLYAHLPILTAQPLFPQPIPHHLYSVLTGCEINSQTSSAAWWYTTACGIIKNILERGRIPIITGGTGLYLHALSHGLSLIPEIPESIRLDVRHQVLTLDKKKFFDMVTAEDPLMKDRVNLNDSQRLARALEVIRTTRLSIVHYWQNRKKIIDLNTQYYVVMPPRPVLYERINRRFTVMVKQGALEEVRNLLKLDISSCSPLLKAIGVLELKAFLEGTITLDKAIQQGQQSTRHYAKRQITWFSKQVPHAHFLSSADDIDKLELLPKLR